ncbi:hypothetical protein KAU33_11155 [Candidatus Dependentiae bacterium]|nr:hypothetical protein [Candidatus Dependentiae bacterium]
MKRKIPVHFFIGLAIIIIAQILMFRNVWLIPLYFTPIQWTGYILMMDALIFKKKGRSMLLNKVGLFILFGVLSIIFWYIFEFYNLYMKNWIYIGMPENLFMRMLGYFWAFATIGPGMMFTAEVLELYFFKDIKLKKHKYSTRYKIWTMFFGLIFITITFFGNFLLKRLFNIEFNLAFWTAPAVWMGFFMLLEPVNQFLGAPNWLTPFENGKPGRFISLIISGVICGFLWEFWNYWTITKWYYDIPYPVMFKIFEMPILGFFGFIPFALEYYAMYNITLKGILKQWNYNENEFWT